MRAQVRSFRDRRPSRHERRDAPHPTPPRAASLRPVDETDVGQQCGTMVHVRRRSARPLILVTGSLDTTGGTLLSAMLDHVRRTEGGTAEVDLTQVDYADSHGLAPVLDGRVPIRGASPVVRQVLRALGVHARGPWGTGSTLAGSGRP